MCPYCTRAKRLLQEKGAEYTEIDVAGDFDQREAMIKKSGGRTSVPQIFINDELVGGSDDLYALERSGELDILLKG